MGQSVKKSGFSELRNNHPKVSFLSGPYLIWKNLIDYFPALSNFIQRDIRLKYRNSLFGFFWSQDFGKEGEFSVKFPGFGMPISTIR